MDAQGYASDIAFTPSVKAIQARKGSRASYHKAEVRGWRTEITPDLVEFIAVQTSFLLATASADGQPYIQHRGGPPGFLRVLDNRTLAFADFSGNRQYITQGNLADNAKAYIFIIDYLNRRRIKLWGTARVVENDAELLARLMPEDYQARPEQVIIFTVSLWDTNCPQHIPQKIDLADVVQVVAERDKRIAELEAEVKTLKTLVPS
ncbi:pyridoxamine 5'-phosphate oxidase family protein [Bradyrhizobium sp. LHD-71]|uniref:pyridoxamine 5'-phosphate oxidase family protein n=1 Tax=Bradyrhizobium sp. LHD-71 TaxID=3072141 RepID=UPI0028104DD9|nr:pyridoxamine 5'-phosphate oxidase family protein [Bradyrhizobium sp. LHD-71]MDQ8728960.1 pyridoxamine 5'-phosphate oxidase family protein [Bradyrhizobium sp. LHD-71]